MNGLFFVPRGGIEPPLPCENWILNPARLPVPPPGHFHYFFKRNGSRKDATNVIFF